MWDCLFILHRCHKQEQTQKLNRANSGYFVLDYKKLKFLMDGCRQLDEHEQFEKDGRRERARRGKTHVRNGKDDICHARRWREVVSLSHSNSYELVRCGHASIKCMEKRTSIN